MDPEKQRKIAKMGGKAVSTDRDHMAAIGAVGGRASGKSRVKKPVTK
jgi:general stress protein YciG